MLVGVVYRNTTHTISLSLLIFHIEKLAVDKVLAFVNKYHKSIKARFRITKTNRLKKLFVMVTHCIVGNSGKKTTL